MKCPRCQSQNREGVRFCEECGGRLVTSCASCGAELLPDKKFCGSCGHGSGCSAVAVRVKLPWKSQGECDPSCEGCRLDRVTTAKPAYGHRFRLVRNRCGVATIASNCEARTTPTWA